MGELYTTLDVSGGVGIPRIALLDSNHALTGFEFDLTFGNPLDPFGDDLWPFMEPEYIDEGMARKLLDGEIKRVEVGLRFICKIQVELGDKNTHRYLAMLRNHQLNGGILRLWPHSDNLQIFMDCFLTDDIVTETYYRGRYVARGPMVLNFESTFLIDFVPSDGWEFYFCAVGEGGYAASEISYYCKVSETYGPTDNVTYWNKSRIVSKSINGADVTVAQLG